MASAHHLSAAAKYNKDSRVGPGAYDVAGKEVLDACRKATPRGFTFAKGRVVQGSGLAGTRGGRPYYTPKMNVHERRAMEAKRAEAEQLARLDELRKDDYLHPTSKKSAVLKNSPRFSIGTSSREQASRAAAVLGGSNGASALSPRLGPSPRIAHPPLPVMMDAVKYS